jgi:O-antigen/teichoic acid export membrane protein
LSDLISPPPAEGEGITRKAGRGIFWNFLTYGLGKGGVLITTSILARLLDKGDFGLVSYAVIAINYLSVIKDLGLGAALVQRRENIEEGANTVFTTNLILGTLLSTIAYFIAPWMAGYFNEPMVTPVLRWLGLSFTINALGAVHGVLLVRELDYRRKIIPDMGNTVVKAVVSIGLAVAGYGVWALVFGQLLGSLASVILVWMVSTWRPKLSFNRAIARSLFLFGFSIILGDVLSAFIDNTAYVIVGKLFGTEKLSIYTLAFRLPEVILIGNLWVMSGVTFPAFSSIQHKPDEMRRGSLLSIRIIQLLAAPISVGLLLAADPIVRVVFGEKWVDVIPLLRVLAIYAWIYSVGYHVGDIYKAIGRPYILLILDVLTLVVLVPALLIGSRFGLTGIVFGLLFTTLTERIVGLMIASRFVHITFLEIFGELKPALLGALVMAPVVLAVLYFTRDINVFLQLALVVIFGALAYLGVLWRVEKENLMRLVQIFTARKK